MSIKERLQVLNSILAKLDKPTLKSWSKSGAALEERIKTEQALVKQSSKKSKRITIATVCRDGFAAGLSNDQIHDILLSQASDVNYDESKKWYVAWYRAAERRKSKAA